MRNWDLTDFIRFKYEKNLLINNWLLLSRIFDLIQLIAWGIDGQLVV